MSETSVTTITLKKINRSKVYQYIYRERLTSKLQIVQDLRMGLSTVSQNLTLLEKEGLIERNGHFDSTGGRKAQAIRIVPTVRLAIGLGILKDMLQIAAVNLYGEAVCTETIPLPYENSDAYYERLAAEVRRFLSDNAFDGSRILGVSIATQGIVSPDGSSVNYGVIMGNSSMKLSDFSSRLPYPCRLEHDSKAAASLELWNHREIDSAVVFLLNRNLGGAVITGRNVHQGSTMHSGALEHLCINQDGPLCYCGNRGCLETYCSANALETIAGVPVRDFFQILRQGENAAFCQIWSDYLKHLAFAMRNLNMVIDSPIILSGYLAPYITGDDLNFLLAEINRTTPFPIARDRILVGTHGQYTPAIGAALAYIEQFLASV